MFKIKTKRIYEEPKAEDGYRVLVDRLWPRGISKEATRLDEWDKLVAPSTGLRKWFGHKPELFEAFKERYAEELKDQATELKRLKAIVDKQDLCLLYAAKDPEVNHAVVLAAILKKIKS
ncbi:MAG: hypothetical protein BGO09_12510 [Bacteroidetes bacterium 47-18]|nr:MAG: hypothetical protein BGO09_12510 [Bacteroidetes bacterium 47-18]